MTRTVQQAVGIIAALSLLLGLSLGQLHDKHRTIERMKGPSTQPMQIYVQPSEDIWVSSPRGLYKCRKDHHRMEEIRSRMEEQKARMEAEKARLMEEVQRTREEINQGQTHVILREDQ